MEDGFDGCNPSSNGSLHQQHNQLQSQQHGTRRRVKRRYRRNQDAINFLRRFTLAVVIIELMLAISESSLMSTFFLYLTLSSTFDVKPESVMDIYCYSQPPGNVICENYMQRVIGYPSMPPTPTGNHRYRGNNSPFPASSPNIENHFPSVPSRPVLTDNELLQLLFLYNQSFYDAPAKLAISRKINEKSSLSKFYSHLIYLFYESRFKNGDDGLHNKSTSNITSPENLSSFTEAFQILKTQCHDKIGLSSHLRQSLEAVSSSAPWIVTYIPQIQTKSGTVPLRRVQNETSPRETVEVVPKKSEEIRLKEQRSTRTGLVGGKRNGLSPSSHRDLIQAKDFIRHRWKRNSMAFPPTFVEETPSKHSMNDPEVLSAAIGKVMTTAESKMAISAMEMADNQGIKEPDLLRQYYITRQPKHQPATVTQERGIGNKRDNENDIHTNGNNMRGGDVKDERKETGGWQETLFITNTGKMKQKQEDDDHDRSTSTLIPIITTSFFETPLSQSFVHSTVKSNIQMTTSEMNPKDVHTKARQEESREQFRNQPQPSSFTSDKQPDPDNSQTKADTVKPSLQMIIAAAETNLNEFMGSFDTGCNQNPKRNSDHQVNNYASFGSAATSKEARTISYKRKNQKWKNVYEMVAKLEKSPRQLLNLMETSLFNNWLLFVEYARQKAMSVNAKNDTNNNRTDNNSLENLRMKQFEDLTMNMEMDIFSPETYQVAERRKRAMEQIYHDYSSVIIGELSLLKEIPISCSFQYVYLGVKIYVLAWHVAICSVLFFGSIFEDKTALNIWGILNILSSFLHFMVDEWINTTVQPEKTSSCIWFGVIYGVYKPITILLVGTLSSEILKKKGFKRKGLLANLREVIMGRKRPPLAGKYAEKLEDFSVSADDVKTELIKAQAKPLEESCSLCDASSTSSTSNKSGKLLIKSDKVGLKSKNRIGSGSCCPCSLTTSDQAQDDLFDMTEEEEEEDEDELEEVIDDDDDSEDDDESDNDYHGSNDPSQGQGKIEQGEANSLTNTLRPSLNNSPKLVLFSETKNTNTKPVESSTGHDVAGTQGNLMLNGAANGISGIRGDSLNGPIVEGGNLHI